MRLPAGLGIVAVVALLAVGSCGRPAEVARPASDDLTAVSVWFVDSDRYDRGERPDLASVRRLVPSEAVIDATVAALFAGPTEAEAARGLVLVTSGATGTSAVGVERSTALVQLRGGCASGGQVITIASLLAPTLRQFDGVRWVKVYAPDGSTEAPGTPGDSVPECLQP